MSSDQSAYIVNNAFVGDLINKIRFIDEESSYVEPTQL